MTTYVLKPEPLGDYCSLREGLMWIAFRRFPEYSVPDIFDKYFVWALQSYEDGALDIFIHYFFGVVLPNLLDIEGNKMTDDYSETDENYELLDNFMEEFYHDLFVKLRNQKIALYGIPKDVKTSNLLDPDDLKFEQIETEEIIYDFIDWHYNEIKDPDTNSENSHFYSLLFISVKDLLREYPIKTKYKTTVQELDNVFLLADTKLSNNKLVGRKPKLGYDTLNALEAFCKNFIKNNPEASNKTIIYACDKWLQETLGQFLPFTTLRGYVTPIINAYKTTKK